MATWHERRERRRQRLERAVEIAKRKLGACTQAQYESERAWLKAVEQYAARVRRLEALLREGDHPLDRTC